MPRIHGTKTPIPGVWKIGKGLFRVRAKWECPRTGAERSFDRKVSAATPTEAVKKREAMVLAAVAPKNEPTKVQVGAYARSWIASKTNELKPSTARLYADVLELHVLPAFGNVYVHAITRADLLKWRDAMKGKPPSINGRMRVFRTMLGDACRELGLQNPAANVRAIRAARIDDDDDRAGSKVLTADELGRLLEAVRTSHPQWYPLILTIALTGMRFGEASALKVSDIAYDIGVITIRRAHVRGKVGTPKTGKTRRTPLPPLLAEVLKAHRASLEDRRALGADAGWLFPSAVGGLSTPDSIRKPLHAAAKAAKLGRLPSAHWLRHTASDLLRRVAAGQVQRSITGHSTEAMAEHYSHVGMDEKKEAMGRVLRLVPLAAGGT